MKRFACFWTWIVLATVSPAFANPSGPRVANGHARFGRPDARTLSITNSPNAIINWRSFSIDAGEITRFIQQAADSTVLNRVVDRYPSAIFGQLSSNGRVFLINPHGMVFGPGAVIDTAGFVASTLNITDADFLSGNLRFAGDGNSGGILNRGGVTVGKNGDILLIAPRIENSGILQTDGGHLLLAAGQAVTITSLNLKGVHFEVQAPENEVVNLGRILADGGAVGIFSGTLTHSGEIRADGVGLDEAGNVVLTAKGEMILEKNSVVSASGATGGSVIVESDAGDTLVSGSIEAAGVSAEGGEIQLLGERVGMFDSARADASGVSGGGSVLVGGDFQGRGSVKTASATYVGPDAELRADAEEEGDGGRVIVWAEESAKIHGALSARGGKSGGEGGLVETSGKRSLEISSTPDVTAPGGEGGLWLIDPHNIDIVAGSAVSNITPTNPFAPTGDSASLGVQKIYDALTGSQNVMITTNTGGSQDGNINLNTDFDLNQTGGTNSLTFIADKNININNKIYDSTPGSQVLNLKFATNTGRTSIGANIDTGGGTIDASSSGTGAVEFSANATIDAASLSAKSIDVNNRTVNLNAASTTDDLNINGGTLTGTGSLTAHASGSGTVDFKSGTLNIAGGLTTSGTVNLGETGNVTVDGAGAAGSKWTHNSPGVIYWKGSQLILENEAEVVIKSAGGIVGGSGGSGIKVETSSLTVDTGGAVAFDCPVTLDKGTLDVSGAGTVLSLKSGLTMTGAAFAPPEVNGNGDILVYGSFDFSWGSLRGTGAFKTYGTSSIGGGADATLDARPWGNYGDATVLGNSLVFSNTPVFTNQSGASFKISSTGHLSGGGTFDNSGELVQDSSAAGNNFEPALTNRASGTFNLNNGTIAFDNTVTNYGEMNLASGTTMTVNGGLNIMSGGVLAGSGSTISVVSAVANDGKIQPGGSSGQLSINGNYTQGSGAVLTADLSGTNSGSTYLLDVSGTATLNGTLDMAASGGESGIFDLFEAGTISGDFSTVNPPSGYSAIASTVAGAAVKFRVDLSRRPTPPPPKTPETTQATPAETPSATETTISPDDTIPGDTGGDNRGGSQSGEPDNGVAGGASAMQTCRETGKNICDKILSLEADAKSARVASPKGNVRNEDTGTGNEEE